IPTTDGAPIPPINVDGHLAFLNNDVVFAGTITSVNNVWSLNLKQSASSTTPFTLTASYDTATSRLTGTVTIAKLNLIPLNAPTDGPPPTILILTNLSVSIDLSPSTGMKVTVNSATLDFGGGFTVAVTGTYKSVAGCGSCLDVSGTATLAIAGHGSATI